MSFDQAFSLTVGVEGGYTDSPADPGNWTGGRRGSGELLGSAYGISAAFVAGLPASDSRRRLVPKDITPPIAQGIYRDYFWDVVHGDDMHPAIAGMAFDAAVNQGPGWAPRMLQSALGVHTDGIIGPATIAAAKRADPASLHAEMAAIREQKYRADPDFVTFGRGWMRRLMLVTAATWTFN